MRDAGHICMCELCWPNQWTNWSNNTAENPQPDPEMDRLEAEHWHKVSKEREAEQALAVKG